MNYMLTNECSIRLKIDYIWDALRDLVRFVQFKKHVRITFSTNWRNFFNVTFKCNILNNFQIFGWQGISKYLHPEKKHIFYHVFLSFKKTYFKLHKDVLYLLLLGFFQICSMFHAFNKTLFLLHNKKM